jgi:signal transduction histidine kinase
LTVELSPPILEREGLLEALKWLAAHMKEFFGLQVTVESKDHPRTSTEEQRILLYQIVRELLFNVVKHAGIMEASIWLEKNEDGLDIIVKDEGDGFDVEAALGESGAGFGLRSINERLRLFDGWTEVKSQPGQGTQVRLFLPT